MGLLGAMFNPFAEMARSWIFYDGGGQLVKY